MQKLPSGQAKRKEIDILLGQLNDRASADDKASLERLKVLGREPKDADPLFSSKGINILLKHGLEAPSFPGASREALSCLANCMLLQPLTRSLAVQLGAAPKIAERYQDVHHHIDEFLCARLLLVMTYGTFCDFRDLILKQGLCQSISNHLKYHADHTDELQSTTPIPSPPMALAETLKLLFSLSKRCPEDAAFDATIQPLIQILIALPSSPKSSADPLITHLIDAMHILSVDDENKSIWFPSSDSSKLSARLITHIQHATVLQKADLDSKLASAIILLLLLHPHAPIETKSLLRSQLLPSEAERDKPLGQSDTLPSRLLQLTTSGSTPQLRELIPELFFELSERDPQTFVNNVGYGYASGYLTNNKIPYTPASSTTTDGTAGETSTPSHVNGKREGSASSGMRTDVNPVTGQFLEREENGGGVEMTEEEKMREAERLFVLFDRLKATGMVDVNNPVREAMENGKLEELDGSEGEREGK